MAEEHLAKIINWKRGNPTAPSKRKIFEKMKSIESPSAQLGTFSPNI